MGWGEPHRPFCILFFFFGPTPTPDNGAAMQDSAPAVTTSGPCHSQKKGFLFSIDSILTLHAKSTNRTPDDDKDDDDRIQSPAPITRGRLPEAVAVGKSNKTVSDMVGKVTQDEEDVRTVSPTQSSPHSQVFTDSALNLPFTFHSHPCQQLDQSLPRPHSYLPFHAFRQHLHKMVKGGKYSLGHSSLPLAVQLPLPLVRHPGPRCMLHKTSVCCTSHDGHEAQQDAHLVEVDRASPPAHQGPAAHDDVDNNATEVDEQTEGEEDGDVSGDVTTCDLRADCHGAGLGASQVTRSEDYPGKREFLMESHCHSFFFKNPKNMQSFEGLGRQQIRHSTIRHEQGTALTTIRVDP